MSKAIGVLGAGLGIVGLGFVFAVVQADRLQGRVAGLERSVRDIEKSLAVKPPAPVPSSSPLEARVEALEKALAARPAAAGSGLSSAEPVPTSPAFREGVRVAYHRIKDEEQAEMIVQSRGDFGWRIITDFIGMDESQAAALKPVFADRGAKLKAFRDQALAEGRGDFIDAVHQKDDELGHEIYPQVKAGLRPSQWFTAKIALGWRYPPEERVLLERWESISRSFRLAPGLRPPIEEAIRQLNEESERNEGKPDAVVRLRTREREVSAAMVERLAPNLPENQVNALKAALGLSAPPGPDQNR